MKIFCVQCKNETNHTVVQNYSRTYHDEDSGIDYRGTWDKESASFKWDEPIEKLWSVNQTILGQLQTIKTKRGKPLTDLVLEVMRTGTGKTDTSYNFEQAFDDDDKKLVAVDWDEEHPKLSILLAPMTDEQLVEKGFEAPDEK